MRQHAVQMIPEEACGLLGGRDQEGSCQVETVIPATNVLHSPVRYRMDPREQLQAFDNLDSRGLDLVGIYHSHPSGPDVPSPTDITEAYYPAVVYLILSRTEDDWNCLAFQIVAGQVARAALFIVA